jgi:hypothetical protein
MSIEGGRRREQTTYMANPHAGSRNLDEYAEKEPATGNLSKWVVNVSTLYASENRMVNCQREGLLGRLNADVEKSRYLHDGHFT